MAVLRTQSAVMLAHQRGHSQKNNLLAVRQNTLLLQKLINTYANLKLQADVKIGLLVIRRWVVGVTFSVCCNHPGVPQGGNNSILKSLWLLTFLAFHLTIVLILQKLAGMKK